MTATTHAATVPSTRHRIRPRHLVGGFYLSMGGVHLGITAADTQFYKHFADGAMFGFVRSGWSDVFMASPHVWGLVMCLGETTIGLLLLLGGARAAKVGWVAAIAFHVCLMLFGWGFWLWSVPALVLLVMWAVHDWPRLAAQGGRLAD